MYKMHYTSSLTLHRFKASDIEYKINNMFVFITVLAILLSKNYITKQYASFCALYGLRNCLSAYHHREVFINITSFQYCIMTRAVYCMS